MRLTTLLILTTTTAFAQPARPDPARTPGAYNPAVTQETIATTICVPGWTRTIRPASKYTAALKREQLRAWGYVDQRPAAYEEDHAVPLELGGAPSDPLNLWPEPWAAGGWGARRKDVLENALHRLVCAGQLSLDEARQVISEDWVAGYGRFVRNSAGRSGQ